MTRRPDLFWGLVASMWIGNVMLVVLNLPMIGLWVKLLQVPYRLLFPAIMAFSAIGIFSVNSSSFEIYLYRAVRRVRIHLHEAWLPAGANAARICAGADDGGEPAPLDADVRRRPFGIRDPPHQPRLYLRKPGHTADDDCSCDKPTSTGNCRLKTRRQRDAGSASGTLRKCPRGAAAEAHSGADRHRGHRARPWRARNPDKRASPDAKSAGSD
jgi:Tripartite tricarboxylate transporter TctA family